MDELWLFSEAGAVRISIESRPQRPLPIATIKSNPLPSYGGTLLAGLLGYVGAIRIAERFPVLIEAAQIAPIYAAFDRICRSSRYFDRAILVISPTQIDGSEQGVDGHRLLLLTAVQVAELEPSARSALCRLSNGQLVRTLTPAIRQIPDRSDSMEMQPVKYVSATPRPPLVPMELELQSHPSQPFHELLSSSHSYHCVLNPSHQRTFGHSYIIVRNPYLEEDYPNIEARLGVLPKYDSRVPNDRIVLDASSLLAIGLPHGELFAAMPAGSGSVSWRSRFLGNRHALARVVSTDTTSMEKPLVRLSDTLFDIIGVQAGGKVVIEAVHGRGERRVSRIVMRALPTHDLSLPHAARIGSHVPEFQHIMGDEDLAPVQIDLAARERLGISTGSAVYVRPAISGLLSNEFTSLSLVLATAVFSSAALQNVLLAGIAAGVYVALVLMMILSRVR